MYTVYTFSVPSSATTFMIAVVFSSVSSYSINPSTVAVKSSNAPDKITVSVSYGTVNVYTVTSLSNSISKVPILALNDDKLLFEMLILESFQAGLSWKTILLKRDAFKKAFDDFNVQKVSKYTDEKIEKLMKNPDIIRHRLKIKSAVLNAKIFIEIQQKWGSFSNYLWHAKFPPKHCNSLPEN